MKLVLFIIGVLFITMNVDCITLYSNNNKIYCDNFECPAGTFKCVVSQRTTEDLQNIRSVRECRSAKGEIIVRKEDIVRNPFPGVEVNNYAESGGLHSSIISNGPSNNIFIESYDQPRFNNEEARRITEETQQNVRNIQRRIEHQNREHMRRLNEQLREQSRQLNQQRENLNNWSKTFQENLNAQLQRSLPRF